jgi:hypothetical protein
MNAKTEQEPRIKAASFAGAGTSRNLSVGSVQQTTIAKSTQEVGDGGQGLVQGAGKLIEGVRERHDKQLHKDIKGQFAATVAATSAAGLLANAGTDLSRVDDSLVDAAVADQLGEDGRNHPALMEGREFFRKLGSAQDTNRPMAKYAQTLALAKVTELVAKNGLWEDEIRAAAKDGLGYDPTGSDMKESFNLLSQAESDAEAARLRAANKPLNDYQKGIALYSSMDFTPAAAASMSEADVLRKRSASVHAENVRNKTATEAGYFRNTLDHVEELTNEGLGLIQVYSSLEGDARISGGDLQGEIAEMIAIKGVKLERSLVGASDTVRKRAMETFRIQSSVIKEIAESKDWGKVINAENALANSIAVEELSSNKDLLVMTNRFGQAAMLDVYKWASTKDGNENLHRAMMATNDAYASFDRMGVLDRLNKTMTIMETGKEVEDPAERTRVATYTVTRLTGDHGTDDEIDTVFKQSNTTIGSYRTLELLDRDDSVKNVLENPKYRATVRNLYLSEMAHAEQESKRALDKLNGKFGLRGEGLSLTIDSTGAVSTSRPIENLSGMIMAAKIGLLATSEERQALDIAQTNLASLEHNIARLQNLSNLYKRYSGSFIEKDPEFVAGMIDRANKGVDLGSDPVN